MVPTTTNSDESETNATTSNEGTTAQTTPTSTATEGTSGETSTATEATSSGDEATTTATAIPSTAETTDDATTTAAEHSTTANNSDTATATSSPTTEAAPTTSASATAPTPTEEAPTSESFFAAPPPPALLAGGVSIAPASSLRRVLLANGESAVTFDVRPHHPLSGLLRGGGGNAGDGEEGTTFPPGTDPAPTTAPQPKPTATPAPTVPDNDGEHNFPVNGYIPVWVGIPFYVLLQTPGGIDPFVEVLGCNRSLGPSKTCLMRLAPTVACASGDQSKGWPADMYLEGFNITKFVAPSPGYHPPGTAGVAIGPFTLPHRIISTTKVRDGFTEQQFVHICIATYGLNLRPILNMCPSDPAACQYTFFTSVEHEPYLVMDLDHFVPPDPTTTIAPTTLPDPTTPPPGPTTVPDKGGDDGFFGGSQQIIIIVLIIIILALAVAGVVIFFRRRRGQSGDGKGGTFFSIFGGGSGRGDDSRSTALIGGGSGGTDGVGPHALLDGKYKILSRLGKGSFSVVYLVERVTDRRKFALKYVLCADDADRMEAIKECDVVHKLQDHPNVIRLVDMFMSYRFDRNVNGMNSENGSEAGSGMGFGQRQKQNQRKKRGGGLMNKKSILYSDEYLRTSLVVDRGEVESVIYDATHGSGSAGAGSGYYSSAASSAGSSINGGRGGRMDLANSGERYLSLVMEYHEKGDVGKWIRDLLIAERAGAGTKPTIAALNGSRGGSAVDGSKGNNNDLGMPSIGSRTDATFASINHNGSGTGSGAAGGNSEAYLMAGNGTTSAYFTGPSAPGTGGSVPQQRGNGAAAVAAVGAAHLRNSAVAGVGGGYLVNPAILEGSIVSIAYQVLSVLHFMHNRSPPIIHRDLKPENILLSSVVYDNMSREEFVPIVVTDFGLSRVMDAAFCETGVGSLPYVAPECWQRHYTTKIDIWALGCILYGMCTRRVAAGNVRVMFSEVNRPDFKDSVRREVSERNGYSEHMATFILSMLEPDPQYRPTAGQLLLGVKKLGGGGTRPSGLARTPTSPTTSSPALGGGGAGSTATAPPQSDRGGGLFGKGARATKTDMSTDAKCVFYIDPDFTEVKDDPFAPPPVPRSPPRPRSPTAISVFGGRRTPPSAAFGGGTVVHDSLSPAATPPPAGAAANDAAKGSGKPKKKGPPLPHRETTTPAADNGDDWGAPVENSRLRLVVDMLPKNLPTSDRLFRERGGGGGGGGTQPPSNRDSAAYGFGSNSGGNAAIVGDSTAQRRTPNHNNNRHAAFAADMDSSHSTHRLSAAVQSGYTAPYVASERADSSAISFTAAHSSAAYMYADGGDSDDDGNVYSDEGADDYDDDDDEALI